MIERIKKYLPKEEDWETLAATLLKKFPELRIFLLHGDLGAGKTTLVKALVKNLGCREIVQSPTFSIINEYIWSGGSIFHMDLYRLESLEEIFDIGFEEYIASGAYCFIEWPDKAEELLRGHVADIFIRVDEETGREVTISVKNL